MTACNSTETKSDYSKEIQGSRISDTYQLTLWYGGGFTGLTEGFTMTSDGNIQQWQSIPGKSRIIQWTVTGHLSEINQLHDRFINIQSLGQEFSQTGNMTSGIIYKINEKTFTWTWDQANKKNEAIKSLQDWYQHAIKFCRSCRNSE